MKNKIAIGGLVMLLFVVVGVTYQTVKAYKTEAPQIAVGGDYIFNEATQPILQLEEQNLGLADSQFVKYAVDVIGDKTATTTTFIPFGNAATGGLSAATSTYVTKVGPADEATYTFFANDASSTARVVMNFEASNDDYCDTTATSGGNLPLVSEIAWFDIGSFLGETVHPLSYNSASSTKTVNWDNPTNGQGIAAHLHHLDFECLRLGIKAASTTLRAQITTKMR